MRSKFRRSSGTSSLPAIVDYMNQQRNRQRLFNEPGNRINRKDYYVHKKSNYFTMLSNTLLSFKKYSLSYNINEIVFERNSQPPHLNFNQNETRNHVNFVPQQTNQNKTKYYNNTFLYSSPKLILLILLAILLVGLPNKLTSAQNSLISQQSKHSGQLYISQLCAGKSQFPVIRRVEGAMLSSNGDSDVNCSITFRTKSAHQHFAIRFEKLKLGCYDHLKMVDGDVDYGPLTIKDFSCKDSLATVPLLKTTGTYLTLRFTTDNRTQESDGFRFVITAMFDSNSDCPNDYTYCKNRFCISRHLFCDHVNHCIDNSDEGSDCQDRFGTIPISFDSGYVDGTYRFNSYNPSDPTLSSDHQSSSIDSFLSQRFGSSSGGSLFNINLTNAVMLLGCIIFIIVIVTLIVLWCINCRVDQTNNAYAQYQHQLQRTIQGVPIQSSASLMFTNANHHHPNNLHHHHPNGPQFQYQYFQPTPQLTPFVTPQHQQAAALAGATLPRGYSTLPLNHVGHQRHQSPVRQYVTGNKQTDQQGNSATTAIVTNPNHRHNIPGAAPGEYLMMTGLTPGQNLQTNLFLPNSQSIIATTGLTNTVATRYPTVISATPTTPLPRASFHHQQQTITNSIPTTNSTTTTTIASNQKTQ